MTRNQQKIMALTRELRVSDTSSDKHNDLLRQIILTLADEVIYLSRELETVRTAAGRAERMSRIYRG